MCVNQKISIKAIKKRSSDRGRVYVMVLVVIMDVWDDVSIQYDMK